MTGELTLRGTVLPVGGIKEKVLAARRGGITTVIIPKKNDKDVKELPKTIRRGMHFVFVEHVDEVLDMALGKLVREKSQLGVAATKRATQPMTVH